MSKRLLVMDAPGEQPAGHAFSQGERVALLKCYGEHPMAFSTLQPGMSYFDLPGVGYIAYARHWGTDFVLADPICDPKRFEEIISAFAAHHPRALYVQVGDAVAEILHRKHGYYATQFGQESKVPLCNWDLRGAKKQIIRTAVNQARAQGVEVRENRCEKQTRDISEAWIRTRKCSRSEIQFLIRPMLMDYTEGTRYFYAYRGDEALGFVHFDPIYRNGNVIAYAPNISRASTSFKQGLWYPMMVHAMDVFKSEGIEYVDMGLIPLMLDEEIEARESIVLRAVLGAMRHWGNSLYNFKGLAFAKSRFQGRFVKTYACHRTALPAVSMLAMFRLMRLI